MTIDPRFMEFQGWAAQTVPLLTTLGQVPNPPQEAEWKSWARSVQCLPSISALKVAAAEQYADWRSWAYEFNFRLNLLGL